MDFKMSPWQKDYTTASTKEGMNIEFILDKIKDNPGSKLLLNSLWGKFGQRLNMKQTYVADDSDFYKVLFKNTLNTNIALTNDNVVKISYNNKGTTLWRV